MKSISIEICKEALDALQLEMSVNSIDNVNSKESQAVIEAFHAIDHLLCVACFSKK